MLVLSRKKNEKVIIGDNIEVRVIDVRGDRVKLGFIGPQDVPIHREEIFRRIDEWSQSEQEACQR